MLEAVAISTAPTLKEIASAQSHELLILRSLLEGATFMCADQDAINIQMVLDVALERLDAIHGAFQPHV